MAAHMKPASFRPIVSFAEDRLHSPGEKLDKHDIQVALHNIRTSVARAHDLKKNENR